MRTCLTLACLTGTPVRVFNIRAGRRSPGLRPQHVLSASAAAHITGGALTGAEPGSREITFTPGPLSAGTYTFDVAAERASAGSTGLVFQTLALPLSFAPGTSRVIIKGGTHVEWSPSADYIKEVFLPAVKKAGVDIEVENPVKGFYPVGGGELLVTIKPCVRPLLPVTLTERGAITRISILSTVANLPLSIAKRQLDRAQERLGGLGAHVLGESVEVRSPGRGTAVFILAEFEKTRAGFSALGARGKRAEAVADEAAESFLAYLGASGVLDPHLSDQVMLPMALAEGVSAATTTEVTGHLRTNIHVIEKFLPVKFDIRGETGREGQVTVAGAAYRGKE